VVGGGAKGVNGGKASDERGTLVRGGRACGRYYGDPGRRDGQCSHATPR
jgi:hypothetical protein